MISRWRWPELMSGPVLLALATLIINDHLLKGSGWLPGVATGKLSDFAGLFFFPVLLATLFRAGVSFTGGSLPLTRGLLLFTVVTTGLMFSFVKCSAIGANLYRTCLSLLFGGVAFVADPTDLAALVMLPLAFLHGRRHCEGARRS